MMGKLVFLVGVLGIGGYAGHTMMNHDASVIPLPKAQVEQMLVEARTTLPRKTGDGEIEIWSEGATPDGVTLRMKYHASAPVLECQAVLTPIAEDQTRVAADCSGGRAASDSAIARTESALRVPMFEEHILATVNGREFNRKTVDSKEMGIVMGNMGGMQKEALERSREFEQMQNEANLAP